MRVPGWTKRLPWSSSIRPASAFSRVDLPLPLRPTRQARSPRASPASTPANSGAPPNVIAAPLSDTSGGLTRVCASEGSCELAPRRAHASLRSEGSCELALDAHLFPCRPDGGDLLVGQLDRLGRHALADQAVGMVLAHQPTIGGLELVVAGIARRAQHGIGILGDQLGAEMAAPDALEGDRVE